MDIYHIYIISKHTNTACSIYTVLLLESTWFQVWPFDIDKSFGVFFSEEDNISLTLSTFSQLYEVYL